MMRNDTLEQAQQENRAPWDNVFLDTRDFVVFEDKYPVTEGHILVVPKEATQDEIMDAIEKLEAKVQELEADVRMLKTLLRKVSYHSKEDAN